MRLVGSCPRRSAVDERPVVDPLPQPVDVGITERVLRKDPVWRGRLERDVLRGHGHGPEARHRVNCQLGEREHDGDGNGGDSGDDGTPRQRAPHSLQPERGKRQQDGHQQRIPP